MSFTIFATWVGAGVLAGLLAGLVMKQGGYGLKGDIALALVGSIGLSWLLRSLDLFSSAGLVAVAAVAFIGAAAVIAAQRKFHPIERPVDKQDTIWRWGLGAALVAVVAWMILGPAPQPAATAAVIEDKTYAVTPAAIKVQAGIVTGDITEMKVAERVEKDSDRIVTPAKLTALLRLKNTSTDQTVRLTAGKIVYIDAEGQAIKLEDARSEPVIKFVAYGSERLDPGQEVTQSVDVEFPAEALQAERLKEIRLEFAYIPSPYREATVNFAVSIGAGQ